MQYDMNVPTAYIGNMPDDVLGGVTLTGFARGDHPLGTTRLGSIVTVDDNMMPILLGLGFTIVDTNQADTPNNDGATADTPFG